LTETNTKTHHFEISEGKILLALSNKILATSSRWLNNGYPKISVPNLGNGKFGKRVLANVIKLRLLG